MRKLTVLLGAATLVMMFTAPRPASAQALDLTDYMSWWDQLNCPEMLNVVNNGEVEINYFVNGGGPPVSSPGTNISHVPATREDHGDEAGENNRWCVMWDGLDDGDADSLEAAVTEGDHRITRDEDDEIISAGGWWGDLTNAARQIAIGSTAATLGALNSLTTAQNMQALESFEALKDGDDDGDDDDDDDDTDAPALPLVGIGILGLLLAVRGAWLRRA